jgi:hypothetical protein
LSIFSDIGCRNSMMFSFELSRSSATMTWNLRQRTFLHQFAAQYANERYCDPYASFPTNRGHKCTFRKNSDFIVFCRGANPVTNDSLWSENALMNPCFESGLVHIIKQKLIDIIFTSFSSRYSWRMKDSIEVAFTLQMFERSITKLATISTTLDTVNTYEHCVQQFQWWDG